MTLTEILPLRFVSLGRSAKLLLCVAVVCTSAFASLISSVSTGAGASTCSQTGAGSASCSSSTPGPHGPETANALTTATWLSPGGRLEAITRADGPATSASASVTFSGLLVVTGASGSGDLTTQFSGFQDTSGGNQPGTVNPLKVLVGTSSQSLTLPFGGPSPIYVTAPVSFGVLLPFSVSLSDSAMGSMFHDGSYQSQAADALLLEPTFVVTDANGHVIGNAHVEFAPEPGTLPLAACAAGFVLLFLWRKRRAI